MSGRKSQELEGITLLGNQKTKYPDDYAPEVLETFENNIQRMIILSNLMHQNSQVYVRSQDSRILQRSTFLMCQESAW